MGAFECGPPRGGVSDRRGTLALLDSSLGFLHRVAADRIPLPSGALPWVMTR